MVSDTKVTNLAHFYQLYIRSSVLEIKKHQPSTILRIIDKDSNGEGYLGHQPNIFLYQKSSKALSLKS